jgi:hypothetical protein
LRVIVDFNKFSKVLRNLVSNAMKFTPQSGEVTVTIHLTRASSLPAQWHTEERVWKYANARSEMTRAVVEAGLQLFGYLRISVTDTGVGLSMVVLLSAPPPPSPLLSASASGGPKSLVPRNYSDPAEQTPRRAGLRAGLVQ